MAHTGKRLRGALNIDVNKILTKICICILHIHRTKLSQVIEVTIKYEAEVIEVKVLITFPAL